MVPLLTCLLCVAAPDVPPAPVASSPSPSTLLGDQPAKWIVPDAMIVAATTAAYVLPAAQGKGFRRVALDSLGATSLHLLTDVVSVGTAFLIMGEHRDVDTLLLGIAAGLAVGSLAAPVGAMLADHWQGHAVSLGGLLATEGIVVGMDLLSLWALWASSKSSTLGTAFAMGAGPLTLWGWSAGVYTLFAR